MTLFLEMVENKKIENRLSLFSTISFSYVFFICLIPIFSQNPTANGHYLVKREESEDSISPEECIKKIKEKGGTQDSKQKDIECFEIDHDIECDEHCEELGDDKCGGSRGRAYNFQCKNPQKGDKKACCCSIKCESKEETKRHLKDLYADMHDDNRGLCSSFTDSTEAWKNELKKMCSNDDRIHIARKYCLEEKKGEKYFCLKIGECRGKRDETCIGCIAHECVMEGQEEGDHIVVPKEYEKERMDKQDFDKSGVGNVEDLEHMVKKEQHCSDIKCSNEHECNKRCRTYCKDHGNKNCNGNTLTYGTAVEGKQGGGKHGKNKCCCQPICSGKEKNKVGSGEDDVMTEEITEQKDRKASKEGPDMQHQNTGEGSSEGPSKDREASKEGPYMQHKNTSEGSSEGPPKDGEESKEGPYMQQKNTGEKSSEDPPKDSSDDHEKSRDHKSNAININQEIKSGEQANDDQSKENSGHIKSISNEHKTKEKDQSISEEDKENSQENEQNINQDNEKSPETQEEKENGYDSMTREKDGENNEEHRSDESKGNSNSNMNQNGERQDEEKDNEEKEEDMSSKSQEPSDKDYGNPGDLYDAYGTDEEEESDED